MSDQETPRTDAETFREIVCSGPDGDEEREFVLADFARTEKGKAPPTVPRNRSRIFLQYLSRPFLQGLHTVAILEDVFGVTSKPVLSYVERAQVDDNFREALGSQKQIIVYGSSKQGKTALVSKHLPYADNLLVSLTPKTQLLDVYQAVLTQAGVRLSVGSTDKTSTESKLSITARFRAMLPVFGSAEAETAGSTSAGSGQETRYEEIPINIELPQSVADLLKRIRSDKWIILENFHYLPDDVQRQFAFDLRAFQELGVRFVILGVWREKNRMAQFNGDLLDRTVEVPVEPWLDQDFRQVAARGAEILRIKIDDQLLKKTIDASFSSIGVFQELLKNICLAAGVRKTCDVERHVAEETFLESAIRTKTSDYGARHERAKEATK
jgi:hypothetical protein